LDISRALTRVAGGDREAFAEVVEAFQRPLFGFLGRMGLAPAEAAEIDKETFVRAWRNLEQFDPARAQFSTWLFAIARNIALNELTKASRMREGGMSIADAHAASEQSPPVEQVAREQSSERLRIALNQLPLIDRTVLALIYVQGLQIADVAALERTTVGAMKTRLHRARAQLRLLLEPEDEQ
jgi:RNA polymerase sigma-70 factor (ECF subfamily)